MNTIEENSILISTKKLAGIDKDYDVFDLDIVTYINCTCNYKNQILRNFYRCNIIKT